MSRHGRRDSGRLAPRPLGEGRRPQTTRRHRRASRPPHASGPRNLPGFGRGREGPWPSPATASVELRRRTRSPPRRSFPHPPSERGSTWTGEPDISRAGWRTPRRRSGRHDARADRCRIKVELARDLSPASANVRLSHLRSVLRECRRLGLMSAEDHANAIDVGPVRGSRVPRDGR